MKPLVLMCILLMGFALSGCGVFDQFFPASPTATPPVTRTPIPLPTTPPTPRPTTVPPTTAPAQPAAPAQPTAAPKAAQPVPAVPQVPSVTDFNGRFTGRTIEGSFKIGTEQVTYVYRFQRIDVVGNRLRATGTLEYQRGNGQRGSVSGLTALVLTEGDACERVTLETQPVNLPEIGITLPAQTETINLADVGGSNPAVGAMCTLARTVQSNPSNPIVSFLLSQVNRQLESQ